MNICKKLGADTYISGIGGKRYLDEKSFEKNKIILKYQNYNQIRYLHHFSKSFIPNLSILDLLANVGSESGKLLKETNWVFNWKNNGLLFTWFTSNSSDYIIRYR